MPTTSQLSQLLRAGVLDAQLAPLNLSRDRAVRVTEGFLARFGDREGSALFSGPGRTEIGGNHTDHQHGRVLCASVDLDILACAAPNGTDTIRALSEGYPLFEVDLDSLIPREEERNTSAALVRGVAAQVAERGYPLAGVDVYASSNVLSGSGLSSSAAFETLIGTILNRFFCGGALTPVEIAKLGQYAENVYFGKPCGLMDQMGSSVGGCVAIDFADPAEPVVERIDFDFSRSGHVLCIIDTRSDHADLTDDYAAIPQEMGAVAALCGKNYLREVDEGYFYDILPTLRPVCGDRAILRAMYFFDDDRRAAQEAEALKAGDFARFLSLVNQSGLSSETTLQNIWSASDPSRQAVTLTLALGRRLLGGAGAIRVHGGGFAGTVQAFVPDDRLDAFKTGMEAVLGLGTCHVVHIRPVGGRVIEPEGGM